MARKSGLILRYSTHFDLKVENEDVNGRASIGLPQSFYSLINRGPEVTLHAVVRLFYMKSILALKGIIKCHLIASDSVRQNTHAVY